MEEERSMTDDSSNQRPPARDGDAADSASAKSGGGGWSLLKKRGGNLVDKLAGSVKEATRSPLVKQGVEARERGNLPASFHLLKEAFGERDDDIETAGVFWDVAVEYERSEEAVAAVGLLIHHYAAGGEEELAAQYWSEMAIRVDGALAEPSSLVRIIGVLQEQLAEEEDDEACEQRQRVLLMALKAIVHPDNSGLSPGLAVRTAELARDLDPDSALAAARIAHEADDLHQAKRERLQHLICELDPNAPPPPEPEPKPEPEPEEAPQDQSHPARNHPLRAASPPAQGLSDDEVHALRAKLPPSQPGSAAAAEEGGDAGEDFAAAPDTLPDAEVSIGSALEGAPELEVDPNDDSQPELEVDPFAESNPDIDVDLEPPASEPGTKRDETAEHEPLEPLAEPESELEIAMAAAAAAVDAEPEATLPPEPIRVEPELALDAEALVDALVPEEPEVAVEPEPVIVAAEPEPAPGLVVEEDTDDLLVSLEPVSDEPVQPLPDSEVMVFDVPLEVPTSTSRFSDAKVIPGRATELDAEGLWLDVADGRRTRIDFHKIEAIAVARISELGPDPVAVLDLLLNWNSGEQGPLRLVRLRADEIGAEGLGAGAVGGESAVIEVAAEILTRCHPVPLPDPDAVLTGNMPIFDSLATYEREVLQVER
jgi:hypothetical protein